MNIEKCDSHSNNHRNSHYPDQKAGNQKERTTKFTENSYHQRHIASKTKNTWIRIEQIIEMDHLIKAMREEKDSKYKSYQKNQSGNSLPSEILGKQKIIKHTISFKYPESEIQTVCQTKRKL